MRTLHKVRNVVVEEIVAKVQQATERTLEEMYSVTQTEGFKEFQTRWELAAMQLEHRLMTDEKMRSNDYWRIRGALDVFNSLLNLAEQVRAQLDAPKADPSDPKKNPLEE